MQHFQRFFLLLFFTFFYIFTFLLTDFTYPPPALAFACNIFNAFFFDFFYFFLHFYFFIDRFHLSSTSIALRMQYIQRFLLLLFLLLFFTFLLFINRFHLSSTRIGLRPC